MDFSERELEKLMRLSRIECTEEEKKKLRANLTRILAYFQQLKRVNTDGVAACDHVLESMHSVWREDEVGPLLERELFLSNAPSHVGGMIRVPPVMP
jgi:aspartyl-tRNA(Asn)/glutamyl-tRNA(Gln) amidotransferase subunit C